jgi:hypothetical protein
VRLGCQALQLARIEPHPAAAGAAVEANVLIDGLLQLATTCRAAHRAQIEDALLDLLLTFLAQLGNELAILLREVDVFARTLDIAL